MKLFDLHCDTLTELSRFSLNINNERLAVSLLGMGEFEKCTRAFAIFTPDTLAKKAAEENFDRLYKIYEYNKTLVSSRNPDVRMILTAENANSLGGNLENIEKFKKCGVKVLGLTWNGENELGFGQLKNRGLKRFGKECIPVLEQNGITVDVSHLSDRGFEDVCALSGRPFVATHSNSRKICNHKRNLTDEQIKQIIKIKGIIGLNFYGTFLNDNPDKASPQDILRHTEHILSLGGEDALCIGTDFDGAEVLAEFNCDKKLLGLEKLFIDGGFSEKITQKILFENANIFFKTFHKDV